MVAIIGVLATVGMLLLNPASQLQKSRDSKRKSDIKVIQSALELYRSEQGSYPASTNNAVANCPSSSPTSLTTGSCLTDGTDTVYLQAVPVDPKTGLNYYYCGPSDGCTGAPASGYLLYSCLENSGDKDAISQISPLYPNSSIIQALSCPTGSGYYDVANP